jgi:uncharacterized protein (TIGR00255 family)
MVNPAVMSMTGYASRRGEGAGWSWVWDLRSVNGKGLDLRLRLPDWVEGLEPAARAQVAARVSRGNLTLSLKMTQAAGAAMFRVDSTALHAALTALGRAESAARGAGFEMRSMTAAEILSLKGILDAGAPDEDTAALAQALLADLVPLIDDLIAARAREGAALSAVIAGQINRIERLTGEARAAAEARRPLMEATLKENLARVLAGAAEVDPARVAQELAMLVVKADVTEELDRLTAHVAAARKHLSSGGAIGKPLDFLMQEFMREANTLCSKAGSIDLTRIGLDLKTVIDQMREQVQNVE